MNEKRELRREINRLLAIIVLWAMSFTGFGAGIELDPNTQQNANINTAPNGVPVINISTPGRQGTSVNTFREFNVDSTWTPFRNSATKHKSCTRTGSKDCSIQGERFKQE